MDRRLNMNVVLALKKDNNILNMDLNDCFQGFQTSKTTNANTTYSYKLTRNQS